jgi:hypothetical protein
MLGEAMVNAQQEFSISIQQHFGVAVSRRDFVQAGSHSGCRIAKRSQVSDEDVPMKEFQ